MRTKIKTAAGAIRTQTNRRFVAVESHEAMYVARTERGVWICARHDLAEVQRAAAVEAARRLIEGKIEIYFHPAVGRIVKRTDSIETAKKAARAVDGFVFDTVTEELV